MKLLVALAVVVILAVVGYAVIDYSKTETVTLHVTGKESVSTDDGHEYRVYTTEDTYKIGDSVVHPRFNSSNLYGNLPVPSGGPGNPTHAIKLRCEVYGWRVPLFSQFKNILHCDGVKG